VTCEEVCYRISGSWSRHVPELQCFQEEADGRLLLHAVHTTEEGYSAVVIKADGTCVFFLNMAFAGTIRASLFQTTKSRTRTHLLNTNAIAASLFADECSALIGVHSFSGCVTVSAFAGKWKLHVLKILKTVDVAKETFIQLGQT
jgi:hypothetical protein